MSMDNQPEKELNILWNLNIQQNQEKDPYHIRVRAPNTREASIRVRAPNTHISPADPKIKLFKSKIGAL